MEVLMGTSSINGPFSMAMLNNQRVGEKTTPSHPSQRSTGKNFETWPEEVGGPLRRQEHLSCTWTPIF